MDINRNNYESFFLLYVDKELSIAEKKAVEAFVGLNPDLEVELRMLQETLLQPEALAFADKTALHKLDTAAQEDLLCYLHNELAPTKVQELELELAANTALQNEWAILQQTQLDPTETITFTDKASLYRHQKPRVVAVTWWRIAAAALLLGFGIWGGMALLNRDNPTVPNGTVVVTDNIPKSNGALIDIEKNLGKANDTVALPQNIVALQKNMVAVSVPSQPVIKKEKIKVRLTKEPMAVDAQNNLDRLKIKNLENFNSNTSNEVVTTNVLPTNNERKAAVVTSTERENVENMKNTPALLKGNAAVYATNTDNDVGAANDYLAIDNKKARRSGLLRKVSRFFQRSISNRGEGDGLKIAGFEFAVK